MGPHLCVPQAYTLIDVIGKVTGPGGGVGALLKWPYPDAAPRVPLATREWGKGKV